MLKDRGVDVASTFVYKDISAPSYPVVYPSLVRDVPAQLILNPLLDAKVVTFSVQDIIEQFGMPSDIMGKYGLSKESIFDKIKAAFTGSSAILPILIIGAVLLLGLGKKGRR